MLVFLILIIATYGTNGFILLSFGANGVVTSSSYYRGVEVQLMDQLHLGVGPMRTEAVGYVNMASEDDVIYISEVLGNDFQPWEKATYHHEYFHLIQRDLIAKVVGGYPSYSNPIQSFAYYIQLLKLNEDLKDLMPSTDLDLPLSSGIEASADCYSQMDGKLEGNTAYQGAYIDGEPCSPEQIWIVDQMSRGNWPKLPGPTDLLPTISNRKGESIGVPSTARTLGKSYGFSREKREHSR